MNEKMHAIWRWLATSRHERWLEAEVERLREECAEVRRQNWALVNSLVTTAGAPLPQEVLRQADAALKGGAAQPRAGAPGSARASSGRKSWHQLARALEIESAREFHSGSRAASHNAALKGDAT
jgi:hypothetical protein